MPGSMLAQRMARPVRLPRACAPPDSCASTRIFPGGGAEAPPLGVNYPGIVAITTMTAPSSAAAAATLSLPPARIGWIRSARFDAALIFAVLAVALAFGAVCSARPEFFYPLLLIDIWLLGYHHVVATYTRIAFDRESFAQHRFLVLGAPILILLGVVLGVWLGGAAAITTTYLYWQWFHYTRQSYGIEKMYRRKAGLPSGDRLTWLVIYGVPAWGILSRSAEAQPLFLGTPLWYLPVAPWLVNAVGAAALLCCVLWLAQRLLAWRRGELRVAHTWYVLSHVAIFTAGYRLIAHIDHGWLAINVWHNAQYLFIVWLFNTNRFKTGIHAEHRLLSRISQPDRVPLYLAVCVAFTAAMYWPLTQVADHPALVGLPMSIVIFQAINFHHYVVDGAIWKLRKAKVAGTLGLTKS
jgi:hypothetical protein